MSFSHADQPGERDEHKRGHRGGEDAPLGAGLGHGMTAYSAMVPP